MMLLSIIHLYMIKALHLGGLNNINISAVLSFSFHPENRHMQGNYLFFFGKYTCPAEKIDMILILLSIAKVANISIPQNFYL